MPSYAAIAPIAQHRGREPQLACDLDQRPTAARQQGDRLPLELIRKMTPFLAHSTPFRSRRSLAKVSTNAGEAQGCLKRSGVDVLRALLRHFYSHRDGTCFPSYEAIARAAGCCVETVRMALRRLEAAGFITRLRRKVGQSGVHRVRRIPL